MACSQTFNGIPYDCSTSMGGIREVYIANAEDVTGKTLTDGIVTAITLAKAAEGAATAKYKKYLFRKGTGSMTSTLNVDAANGVNYVSTELVLQFAKMETAKRIEIAALAVGELSVIVKDSNGKYWMLGYDEPVTASAGDGSTGTAVTDANKYGITLLDTAQSFPYEVSAEIIADLVD
ncbi:hypothetical protein [Alistipes sp.]|uniref:hypothetical protein n=1 Tax=Alistipes sp. TaxID=1872444 RepID=UPI003AEFF6C0